MGKRDELDTIWEVADDLWTEVKRILDEVDSDPQGRQGRPRIDPRCALNGVIFRTRTSCQWNHLPREFGDDSSVHRTFQRWVSKEVFERVWALLIERCEGLGAVQWEWQAADGVMGKARSRGSSSIRTRLTGLKLGARRASSLMATTARERRGGGSQCERLCAAEIHDFKLLRSTP
jgi:putative transposase